METVNLKPLLPWSVHLCQQGLPVRINTFRANGYGSRNRPAFLTGADPESLEPVPVSPPQCNGHRRRALSAAPPAPAIPEYQLSGAGVRTMPAVGVGTYAMRPEEKPSVGPAVLAALELGYRHIDTGSLYGTEAAVGDAVSESVRRGVVSSREEVFVTSKLWCTQCQPHLVLPSIEESLRKLRMQYVDLYLVHFPICSKSESISIPMRKEDIVPMDLKGVWAAMEQCWRLGLAKAIGVSNFNIKKLQDLLEIAEIPPAVNQVEMNPVCQQKKLRQFCSEKGIHVTAYSPLGGQGQTNTVMNCEELKQISHASGMTVPQISMRWIHQQGASFVVKTFKKERLADNLGIFEWELSEDDHAQISKIPQSKRCTAMSLLSQEGTLSVDISDVDVVDF